MSKTDELRGEIIALMDEVMELSDEQMADRILALIEAHTDKAVEEANNSIIQLEDLLDMLGHKFRDLSYHSDGRWIARSGANTKKFIISTKHPTKTLSKLIVKLSKEAHAQGDEGARDLS